MTPHKRYRGVTLMELLTVVAVIGILASVAVPSYRRYLLRAQRTDGTAALLRVATAQEKHFLQYGTYVTTTANMPNTHAAGGLGIPTTSDKGYYSLTLASSTTGYVATAVPRTGGGQQDDTTCATLTINESGRRTALNSASVDKTSECFR